MRRSTGVNKLQTSNFKLQESLKLQAPRLCSFERNISNIDVCSLRLPWSLKFEVWSFSGAWCLVFGVFVGLGVGGC
jgi:hypothetical protein